MAKGDKSVRIINVGNRSFEGTTVGGYGNNVWQSATTDRIIKKNNRLRRKWRSKQKNYRQYITTWETRRDLIEQRDNEGFFRKYRFGCYYKKIFRGDDRSGDVGENGDNVEKTITMNIIK